MERQRDMKKHVVVVGALHIGFAFLKIIGAIAVAFLLNLGLAQVEHVEIAAEVMRAVSIFIPLLLCVFAVLGIIGGIGVLKYKPWARIMIIVLSALNCLNIPIGTAKGVYSIWTLMQDETISLFSKE